MTLTVVIPSKNQGQWLGRAIKSVRTQRGVDVQLIVVDGGSTDETHSVIYQYERLIDKWIVESDSGQSEAINKGLNHAEGDYFAWLNCDDYYLENSLYVPIDICRTKELDIVVCGGYVEINGQLDMSSNCKLPNRSEMLYLGKTFYQPSVFVATKLMRDIKGVNDEYYYVMDYDLWLRAFDVAQSFEIVKNPVSVSVLHDMQKTANVDGFGRWHYNRHIYEKVHCIKRYARRRDISIYEWLVKSYLLRYRNNIARGSVHNIRPSQLQMAMWKARKWRFIYEK